MTQLSHLIGNLARLARLIGTLCKQISGDNKNNKLKYVLIREG